MLVVGIGGTLRDGSTSELALVEALAAAAERGAEVVHFAGSALELPMFNPASTERSSAAGELISAVRAADGFVLASPGYHGSVSGLLKNALDYIEDTASDERPYFDMRPVGCIAVAYGWQASVNTLRTLRDIVHALRGIPTPFGVTLNTSTELFADGRCVDAATRVSLSRVGEQVVDLAARLESTNASRLPEKIPAAVGGPRSAN